MPLDVSMYNHTTVTRLLLSITLLLILGAATTVGVAWAIASLAPKNPSRTERATWAKNATALWDPFDVILTRYESFGLIVVAAELSLAEADRDGRSTPAQLIPAWSDIEGRFDTIASEHADYVQVACGWPGSSLRCEWRLNRFNDQKPQAVVRDGVIAGASGMSFPIRTRALPLRPIWPGFLIDTLFYTAIWGGLLLGFGTMKRTIRRRRGRCPQCGYDLRGQREDHGRGARATPPPRGTGCPECGWGR